MKRYAYHYSYTGKGFTGSGVLETTQKIDCVKNYDEFSEKILEKINELEEDVEKNQVAILSLTLLHEEEL